LIVLTLFIGGIQMLFLGVIGSYLAHIYEEVKARPPYVVDEILNAPPPRDAMIHVPERQLAATDATAAASTVERRALGS
jgi:hypothetical protein